MSESTDGYDWQPVRRSSLTARIRGEILAYIADRRFGPGERLPSERDLAAKLGVSRPSLREAVKSLEAEGRLDVRHGQGVFVATSVTERALRHSLLGTELDVAEIYAMREVLEVPAAQWAAERSDQEAIAHVRAAHDRLLEASSKDPVDFDELQLLDVAFHQSIVQAAGNRFLVQTQGVLGEILVRGMSSTLVVEGRLEMSRGEHRTILDAILDGDGQAAAEAARQHVRATRRTAIEQSLRQPDR